MRTTDTLVIGAGQAGLALSRLLTERGRDHVVLERGHIGRRWSQETWDSLHLLTPNWANGLPGSPYAGPDPDGFMSAIEFAVRLGDYARSFDAPVDEEVEVESVRRDGDEFSVVTTAGAWRAGNVVIATGWCDRPAVPSIASGAGHHLVQIAPRSYRDPGDLAPGGVLVVGASATGVQLAEELRADGRRVVLAVGRHSRVPRRYRGMDIFWWLERIGALDRTIDEMTDQVAARHEPSLQLVGRPDHRTVDLATLQAGGVELAGRLVSLDGHRARFAGDLAANVMAADVRRGELLRRIDRHIDSNGLGDEVLESQPLSIVSTPASPDELDLRTAGITSILWATGHRRVYDWLQIPVLDARGELRQRRGVTPVPGLYVVGQRFQHFRNSNFIGGVGRDAAHVAEHITHRTAVRRQLGGVLTHC